MKAWIEGADDKFEANSDWEWKATVDFRKELIFGSTGVGKR